MSEPSDPDRNGEWTEEEARALRELADEDASVSLSPALKPRVIENLKAAGLISPARKGGPVWLPWMAAAACAVVGFAVGRQSAASPAAPHPGAGSEVSGQPPTTSTAAGGNAMPGAMPGAMPSGGQRYMFLLTGGDDASPEESDNRRREYAQWAAKPRPQGMIEDGAELTDSRHWLGKSAPGDPVVGYFLVTADNEWDALSIAETTPHLRHGGGVTVAALR